MLVLRTQNEKIFGKNIIFDLNLDSRTTLVAPIQSYFQSSSAKLANSSYSLKMLFDMYFKKYFICKCFSAYVAIFMTGLDMRFQL